MISAAYNYFGCNTADVFIMSVNFGDNAAACILFDQVYGVEFPCISGIEGGGTAINSTYGINAYPTYILIAPNHDIVEQAMWPISSVQTFINYFEDHDIAQPAPYAAFIAAQTEVCESDTLNFTDESCGGNTSWNWTFEGGDPDTSTEQNPVVTYNNEGIYNVELSVANGIGTNTLLMEDYITVLMTPPVMLLPFNDVCVDWPAFELTGGSPVGGVYSGPGVTNGWFDPAVAGLGTHTISYMYTASNGCDNSAQQSILVDPCTGIDEFSEGKMSIYPNPTTGSFELKINEVGTVTISIVNMLGEEVYADKVNVSGKFVKKISLDGNETGIYFIKVQTESGTYVKKLKLLD